MEKIALACLRLRTLVLATAVILLVGGLWHTRHMPIDAVPEFSPVTLQLRTEALGLSAAEVESLITVPLEADLLIGLPWLKSIDSESVSGVSSVDLLFEPGTDLMRARQMVNERMTQARALPNVSSPPTLLLPAATASRIMNIGLSSNSISLIDLSVQAQWTIVPRLQGVPGVANVSVWGLRNRQVQVQVDPARLHESGVTLDQVIRTAGEAVWASPLTYLNSSTPGSGGFIDTPNQRLNVRHVFPITAAEDFASIPVSGTSLALRDVADVVQGHQPLIGDAVLKSGPGLLLMIEKYPGFNTVEVTNAVEAALDELRPGLKGVDIDSGIYRPASFIERATSNLSTAISASAILGSVALLVLLGSWRATVVAIVAIAVSLSTAGLVFYIRGVTFNMMMVAGLLLAITAVVDDAIGDAHNIQKRLRERSSDLTPRWRVVARASAEIRGPMLYATLVLVVAVAPLLLMQGLSAPFFGPLTSSYITAIVVSLLVATAVVPTVTILLGVPNLVEPDGATAVGRLEDLYTRLIRRGMRSWVPGYTLLAGAALAGLLFWAHPQRSLIPEFRESDVFVEVQGKAGTSLGAMRSASESLMRELRAIPGVRDAAAQIGRAYLSREVSDVDSATIWVSTDPTADYEQTLAAMRKVVDSAAGLDGSVQTFLSKRMRESLTGEDQAISVRVYGQDLTILRAKAEEIRQQLARIKGVNDPEIEPQAEQQAVDVEVDLDKARAFGLKPGDVRRAASTLLGGITTGSIFDEQKIFDVVVWARPDIRKDLADVRNLLIDTESGNQVRLAEVAKVNLVSTPSVIHRQGASRRIDVEAEVSGRSLAAVTEEVKLRIKEGAYPFEYHAEVLGEQIERQAALRSLYGYLVAALVGIVLLLQAALGRWRLAGLVIAAALTGVLGGLLTTYASGAVLSLGSLLGLASVVGLTLRNAMVQVRYLESIELPVGEPEDSVLSRGASERARAILATVVTTGALALPFVIMGNVAGLEIPHAASVVMLGNLVTSAVVSLFIVPAVYGHLRRTAAQTSTLTPEVA